MIGAIRTNLLFDRDDTSIIFGRRVQHDTARYAAGSSVLAVTIILLIFALQMVRLSAVTVQEQYVTGQDQAIAPALVGAQQLGETVVRLQKIVDLSVEVRASGNSRAVEIATLGSSVRRNHNTWLAALHGVTDGWELLGVSASIADLSRAALAIDRSELFSLVSEQNRAGMVSYDAFVRQASRAMP